MIERDRDDLIEDVKYGRMSPAEAEAEATRLGLETFARTPDAEKFNPMGEPFWTLPMTVAWIAWRNSDDVLGVFDPYRTECFDWHWRKWRLGFSGPIYEGHFWEPRKKATLQLLALADRTRDAAHATPKERNGIHAATEELWKALQENRLEATGRSNDNDQRKAIPDHEWRDLTPVEEYGRDVVRFGPLSQTGYTDLTFRRQNVMSLWPPTRQPTRDFRLPPTIRPDGPGYFALYFAAQWIATEGAASDFDPMDIPVWDQAFRQLIARISSGQITVTGVRNGLREKIEGHIFASLRIDYPFSEAPIELILSEEL